MNFTSFVGYSALLLHCHRKMVSEVVGLKYLFMFFSSDPDILAYCPPLLKVILFNHSLPFFRSHAIVGNFRFICSLSGPCLSIINV